MTQPKKWKRRQRAALKALSHAIAEGGARDVEAVIVLASIPSKDGGPGANFVGSDEDLPYANAFLAAWAAREFMDRLAKVHPEDLTARRALKVLRDGLDEIARAVDALNGK